MNQERWQKVEEIFNAAVELSPQERASFISQSCRDDSKLREQVERLLKADEQAEGFIESPVPMSHITRLFDTTVIEMQGDELIGSVIGQYKLIKEIGRGGMGAVFMAERADQEFFQRVAIKLIKRGMDTDFILKRFRNERQILANLNHQNIARLLDGGTTEDGLPYFVMEFIEGAPLTKFCDEKRLTINERLKLFLRVCAAVQFAHENKVLHRDIKPGNILVTKEGVPKLLDFGIAKLLDPELAFDTLEPTATAMRLMTPEYASPEQVRGETVTTATDVYSLGVLLYEILTGHRPYRFPSRLAHDVARVICEEVPIRPSNAVVKTEKSFNSKENQTVLITPEEVCRNRRTTNQELQQELRGDLDNIVLKALIKEPNLRYTSVEDFVNDINRHLEGLPVSAKPIFKEKSTKTIDSFSSVKSLAILPFKTLSLNSDSDDTGDKFLGIGLADALVTRLSNIRSVAVRPTTSVLKFAAEDDDPISVGHLLDVNYVLDGRILKAGDNIRITVQLISVRDGAPLWASQFDEKDKDILSLQDSISKQVSQALVPQLTTEEQVRIARRGTDSPRAYEAFLRGRFHWHTFTEEGFAKAIVAYNEAIAYDPDYALPHAAMGEYYCWLAIFGVMPPRECLMAAKEAATKAIQLDSELSEAHSVLGFAYHIEHKWTEGEACFRRALKLNPNSSMAHVWFTSQLFAEGRFDEARKYALRAIELDPLTPYTQYIYSWGLYFTREFDECIEQHQKTIKAFPQYASSYFGLHWVLRYLKRYDEALKAIEKARELSTDSLMYQFSEAQTIALAGKRENAKAILNEILALSSSRYVSPYHIALVYWFLGDKENTLVNLEKSYEDNEPWIVWIGVEPAFDSLRSEPRFVRLLEATKNPAYLRSKEKQTDEIKPKTKGAVIETPVEEISTTQENESKEKTLLPFYHRLSFARWAAIGFCCLALILTGWFVYSKLLKSTTSKVQRLTNNPASDTYPKVSPDGKKILFISNRDGNSEVYVMNIDGSNVTRLTYNTTYEGYANWSLDGKKILYESVSVSGSTNDFWIMSADGSNQTKITKSDMHTSRPSLSPDGKQIVFASDKDGKGRYDFNIWVMDVDGTNLHKLTDYEEFDSDPAWSPDGKQISFTRATQRGAFDIMIMNADGTNQRNITNTPEVQETVAIWSPDGKQFAFARSLYDTNNNLEIWMMNIDGSNLKQITNNPAQDREPSWTPDGKRLVFQSLRDGNDEIYITSVDDSEASSIVKNTQKTLAILPFKTNMDDGTEKPLSFGLTEAIGSKLSQLKQVSVHRIIIMDEETLQSKKDLGVEFVVSGELQRINDRVQVSARMTQVSDGKILWAEKFDQPFSDITTLQASIADKILQSLSIELTDKETQRFNKRYTEDNEAYQLYLVGRYHLGRRSVNDLKEAIKNFEKAISRDNKFALAYAGLADCYALLALYQSPSSDAYPRAKEFAMKAIEIDESLAEAHTSLAYVKFYFDFDRTGALQEFQRAVELNPSYATAHHWYGLALAAMGRNAQAQEQMELAQRLDPHSAIIKAAAAMVYYYGKNYDEALSLTRQAIELDQGLVPAHRVTRWIYVSKGEYDNALDAYQKEKSFSGSAEEWPVILAQIQASGGKIGEAKNNIQLGVDSAPVKRDPSYLAFDIAIVYGLLNERDKAFFWLEKSLTLKAHSLNYALVDPRLDNLHSDPRFAELLRKAKFSD
jgi:Tol biopolymer transport system component/serine/threonine protein kinase/Tfp pilus assembly protein PilF